jgi:hypothetical protein
MSLDIDILIVFADADNAPSDESSVGWVSQFKKFLEFMLTQVTNEKLKIMLKGEFDTLTSPRLDNVGVLVPVLSKDFIRSTACMQHVETFYNAVNKNSNRIFKVTKSPLTQQDQPDFLRPLIGYNMYQLDPDSGEIREYSDYFSTDAERQYWMELVDLSYDLVGALHRLKNGTPEPAVKNLFNRKIVYVAETSHDLSVERNIITRELQRHGYAVLPDRALSFDTPNIDEVVRKDLDECALSIHMIGNSYGEIPDGSARSFVDLQHKIASDKGVDAKRKNEIFTRLIWIAPNLKHINERQKKFIETIKRDVEMQEGAELLETPLEDFKNIIREELLEAIERKAVKETGGRAIYLLHDREDQQAVKPYIDLIERCGYRVLIPLFEGELLEQRQKHIENLRALDAAIIFKGKGHDQWVHMKALDLMKAPGFGRKKPIVAKAIFAAPGQIPNRESLKSQNFRLIEGDLQHFMEALKLWLLEFDN